MKKLTDQELWDLKENAAESEYLDFKQTHHASTLELVHDILCLANADSPRERYLIYGIADDASLVGLNQSKRTLSDITDTLCKSDINRLPSMALWDYNIEGKKVEVLCIANSRYKPYFLTKDKVEEKKRLRNGIIYLRNGNTNTPIDSCASEVQMQQMWAERFGLTLPPLERIQSYIDDIEEWIKSESSLDCTVYYYKKFPEFTLTGHFENPRRDFFEHWNKINSTSAMGLNLGLINVQLKYYTTTLGRVELINAEYKQIFAVPQYATPDNVYENPNAFIQTDHLENKIAVIFQEARTLAGYQSTLNQFLRLHKLLVEIV